MQTVIGAGSGWVGFQVEELRDAGGRWVSTGKTFSQNQKLKLKFNEIKQQQSRQARSFV